MEPCTHSAVHQETIPRYYIPSTRILLYKVLDLFTANTPIIVDILFVLFVCSRDGGAAGGGAVHRVERP